MINIEAAKELGQRAAASLVPNDIGPTELQTLSREITTAQVLLHAVFDELRSRSPYLHSANNAVFAALAHVCAANNLIGYVRKE